MASHCLMVCLSLFPTHPEALTNLAVVEKRRGNRNKCEMYLAKACSAVGAPYESYYNYAVLLYEGMHVEKCYAMVSRALEMNPAHVES